MSRKIAIAFAIVTMFGAMAAAPASAAQTTTSVSVSYGDLDLDSQRDARRLVSRIREAAATVCGDTRGIMTVRARAEIRACRRETTQRIVDALDHPTVSAMFYGRGRNDQVASV